MKAMGWGVLFQDWITLHTAAAGSVVQTEPDWVAVGDFTDVSMHASVRGLTGGPRAVHLESAPSFDADLFASIGNVRLTASSERTLNVKYALSTAVPAAWLRWRLEFDFAGDITLRLWLTLTRTAR